ncbi:MAG: hypothetical protein IT178_02980 [Acidobacteria bacterium]|nr:hypothetical protein [Acidobacteriota bacterium]
MHPAVPPEVHYDISARLDLVASQLIGEASVRIRNRGALPLQTIRVEWPDLRSSPVRISFAGGAGDDHAPRAAGVVVALPEPIANGQSTLVQFRFRKAVGSVDQGWGSTDWYPRVSWGYETHASYDVALDAPADVLVAASARRDVATQRYRAESVRAFGVYLGRGFTEQTTSAGATEVRAVFRPRMRPCAERLLQDTAEAIRFYHQRLGMYPQPILTIIPGGAKPWGGYPFATAMVVVHGLEACAEADRDAHWRWIAAHEAAHQYWLEHVLAKEPEQGHGWLMIGLGIWTDREYLRSLKIDRPYTDLLNRYTQLVHQGLPAIIEISPDELRRTEFDYNSGVTHGKGFGIISALEQIVGAAAFDRSIKRALKEYAGRRLGTAEFRAIVEAEADQELGWFFVPMLRSSRFASYELSAPSRRPDSGGHEVTVTSTGTLLLPVPVEAVFADGTRQRVTLDRDRDEQTVRFTGTAVLEEVVLDPDHAFPLVVPPPTMTEALLAERLDEMPWTGAGDLAGRLYRHAVELDAKTSTIWRKLGLTLFEGGRYPDALDAFGRLLRVETDPKSGWHFGALAWMGAVSDVLNQREAALGFYRRALATNSSASLNHEQFSLVIDRAWVEARLQKPFAWPRER